MGEINVIVNMGREKWTISVSSRRTFGYLRSLVEAKANAISGGLRLIHKGKSHADNVTLESVGVSSGSKMMAMRTSKQVKDDEDKKRAAKLSTDNTAMLKLKEQGQASGVSRQEGAKSSSSSRSSIKGDEQSNGSHVFLKKGRETFRVNIEMTSLVAVLKRRASSMNGINTEAKDIRVLGKGQMLTDQKTLAECGIRSGATLMILFNARHYDRKEAVMQIGSIAQKVEELEAKTKSVESKANRRLLNGVEVVIARGELIDNLTILKDNLGCVRSNGEKIPELRKRLSTLEDVIRGIGQ